MDKGIEPRSFVLQDLVIAFACCFSMLCIISLLYSLSGLQPGFFLPLLVALVATGLERLYAFRKGKNKLADLKIISKDFIGTAICSMIFGAFMPILFPSGAYGYTLWLVYVNTVFLVAGAMAVPIAKGFSSVVRLVTLKRTAIKAIGK